MSASLVVTTTIQNDQVVVEGVLGPNPDIPAAIFLYENTGTDKLGDYFGVCTKYDFERFQEWTGQPVEIFGNRYVRYTVGRKFLPIENKSAAPSVEKNMVDSCKNFRLEYLGMSVPVTRSYNL